MKKVLSIALILIMLLGISVPVNAADVNDVYVSVVYVDNRTEGVYVWWYTNAEGADSFNVYRRAAGEEEPTLIAENVTENNYLDETAENNTFYKYFVSAVIGENEGTAKESSLTKFVSAPQNIRLSFVNSSHIKVEWDPVPGANYYSINYNAKGDTYTWYWDSTTTSCVIKLQCVASTYEFVVAAHITGYYKSGDSVKCSITEVRTPRIGKIENVPEGLYFTWTNVSNTCKYRVYRRAGGEKYWTYLETVEKKCEYYDSTVKSNVYYTYTVVAEEDGQRSPVAGTNPVTKHVATPKLQAVANATDGCYVRWEPVAGATKYVIYRLGVGEYTWTQLGQVTSGNRFKDNTTAWGQYYRYTVVAVSGNYTSGFDRAGLLIRFFPLGGTWNNRVIFNYYKNAAVKSKDYYNHPPAYVAKFWQNASGVNFTGSNRAFVSEFQNEFRNSFYSYKGAFTVRPYRGTANAEEYLPYCYADASQVKSASVTKKGSNYFVRIVFKDLGMPTETSYGVAGVSPMYYDMKEDVRELYRRDYVESYTASTVYKDYTITAEITPDGKFVNMTHMGPGYVNATMDFGGDIGTVKASGKVICYATYYNFQY